VDLSGADLRGGNLTRANVSRANLSAAELHGASLFGARLSWANLGWADLSAADLSGADLSWANLAWANLIETDLSEADLTGAEFNGAHLGDIEFIDAFQDRTCPDNGSDFQDADGDAIGAASASAGAFVEWGDIAELADRVLNVWTHRQELKWTETTWRRLRSRGITLYSNSVERHLVLLRFLALICIYRDFCDVAWDAADTDYESMCEALGFDEFTLETLYQRLVGSDSQKPPISWKVLRAIVERQRPIVVAALIQSFKDDMSLLRSLWSTAGLGHIDDTSDDFDLVLIAPDFAFSRAKLRAMEWVVDGCQPVQWALEQSRGGD